MVQVYLSSQLSNVPSIMHAWVNTTEISCPLYSLLHIYKQQTKRLETFQNILETSEVALNLTRVNML